MDVAAASQIVGLTDRELWIVTARDGQQRGGLVATFVCAASLVEELPRMLIALATQHHTHQLIEASGAFGLHLIAARQLDWVWRFGLQSGRDADKLAGLAQEAGATGAPLLSDAIGWFDCRVESRMETGDRTVYLAEVIAARMNGSETPLTFKELLKIAPAERLEQLKELRERDSRIDAQAIRAWRSRHA
ncbi:MAG TPA: flavin reductase family protein [Pirellulales bacterium]|nr:flavin reductase family protein [Pirellulales bacterium]